jgi:hypothetical protein
MKLKQHDEQIMSQSKVGRYIPMSKGNSKHSIRKQNIHKTEDICQICNKRDADIFHDDACSVYIAGKNTRIQMSSMF